MSRRITLNCNYIQGYLRDGYFNLELSEEDYEKFKALPKEEQINWITDCGDLVITSYKIEDYKVEDNFETPCV